MGSSILDSDMQFPARDVRYADGGAMAARAMPERPVQPVGRDQYRVILIINA